MRQLGHYHATPEPPDTNRNKPKRIPPRISQYRKNGIDVSFPEIEKGNHLLNIFDSMGRCGQGMGGAEGFTWSEIHAYTSLTGIELSYEEVHLLKSLSDDYAYQLHKSKDQFVTAPYGDEKERVNNLDNFFNSI